MSDEQEIDYDNLNEDELNALYVQSWKVFSHVYSSHSLKTLDARTKVYVRQVKQPVAGGLGKHCGIGLKCLSECEQGKCVVISKLPGDEIPLHLQKKFVSEGHFFVGNWGYYWGTSSMRANCVNIQQDLKPEKANVYLCNRSGDTLKKNCAKYGLHLEDLSDLDDKSYYACLFAKTRINKEDMLLLQTYGKGNTVGPFGTKEYLQVQKRAVQKFNEEVEKKGKFDTVCHTCMTVFKNNNRSHIMRHNKVGCKSVFQQMWKDFLDSKIKK